ncbi:MAG: AMP-dependent synthetase, partial [Gemmatimonadota bacterium]
MSSKSANDEARAAFLAAREVLWTHRTDLDAAGREFRWPKLTRFNWALDHFDAMAEGNDQTGLWIVNEDGSEQKRAFGELARRSNQVANFLRSKGV